METRDGRPVTNIHVKKFYDEDVVVYYVGKDMWVCGPEGNVNIDKTECKYDLFLITPDPELTEFELSIVNTIENELHHTSDDGSVSFGVSVDNETAKVLAKKLFDIARKELVKQGYVIEKKAFHDAVEKIDDKNKAEMSIQYSLHCKVENGTRHAVMNWESFQKLAQHFIDLGKAEALKDLPRWEPNQVSYSEEPILCNGNTILNLGWVHIHIDQMKKLPGFKEDEK